MLKFLNRLEISCNSSYGPTYDSLLFWGLINKNRQRLYNVLHSCAVIFVISQYIELYNIKKCLDLAMRNLSVTMLSTVCIFKAGTFIYWQKYWWELFNFASDLEIKQLSKKDTETKSIIKRYVKYSRSITYFYGVLVIATVALVILAPLFSFLTSSFEYRKMIKNGSIPYPEILSSWVPFDRTKGFGYLISTLEHIIICFYGGSVVANFDCNAVVMMSFFAGQFNLLKINCERLFDADGNEVISYDEAMKRIKNCHYHHLYLLKYCSIFNTLLSPVMFLYVVICSLMICASAIQLTTDGTGSMQRIWIAEYVMALIAQLFLYCWHGNEVFHMSFKVSNGTYFSTWYTQNIRVRRSLLLLGGQLRKSIEFNAGPFTRLNVASFVAILKGSYSYYTLLDRKED